MTRWTRLVMLVTVVLGLAGVALAADVTGTWTAEFDSPIGVQKYVYTFKVEGEKLTGKAVAERMGQKDEVALTNGTVKGEKISFTETLSFNGQELPITYQGTIEGDVIKFTRQVGDFGTEEIVAKRKKE
jgi:hypothetical protein